MKKNNFLVLLLSFIIIFSSTVPSFASIIINEKDEINSENIVNNIDKDIINDNNINKINDKIRDDENSEIIINNDEFNNTSNNNDIIIDNSFEENLKNNMVTSEQTISNNEFTTEELEELRKNIKLDLRMYSQNDKTKSNPLKKVYLDKNGDSNMFEKRIRDDGKEDYFKFTDFDYIASLFNPTNKIIKKNSLIFKVCAEKDFGGYGDYNDQGTNNFLKRLSSSDVDDSDENKKKTTFYYTNTKDIYPGESVTFSGFFRNYYMEYFISKYGGYNDKIKDKFEPQITLELNKNEIAKDQCTISFYSEKINDLYLKKYFSTDHYNEVNDLSNEIIQTAKKLNIFSEILNRSKLSFYFDHVSLPQKPYVIKNITDDNKFYSIKYSGLPKGTLVFYNKEDGHIDTIKEDGVFNFVINEEDKEYEYFPNLLSSLRNIVFFPPKDSLNKEYNIKIEINARYLLSNDFEKIEIPLKIKINPIKELTFFTSPIDISDNYLNFGEDFKNFDDNSYFKLLNSELNFIPNSGSYFSEKKQTIIYRSIFNNSENFKGDYYLQIVAGPIFKIDNDIEKKFSNVTYNYGLSNKDIENISFFKKSKIYGLSFTKNMFEKIKEIKYFTTNNQIKQVDFENDFLIIDNMYYCTPKDLGKGFKIILKNNDGFDVNEQNFEYNIINKVDCEEMNNYAKTMKNMEVIPPIFNISFLNFYDLNNNKISGSSNMDKDFKGGGEFAYFQNLLKSSSASKIFFKNLTNINNNLKNVLLDLGCNEYSIVKPFSNMNWSISMHPYYYENHFNDIEHDYKNISTEIHFTNKNSNISYPRYFEYCTDQSIFKIKNFNIGYDFYIPNEVSDFNIFHTISNSYPLMRLFKNAKVDNGYNLEIILTMLGLNKKERSYMLNLNPKTDKDFAKIKDNINNLLKNKYSNDFQEIAKYSDYKVVKKNMFKHTFTEALKILNLSEKNYSSDNFEDFLKIKEFLNDLSDLDLTYRYDLKFKSKNDIINIFNNNKKIFFKRYDVFDNIEIRDFYGYNNKSSKYDGTYTYYFGNKGLGPEDKNKYLSYIPNCLKKYYEYYKTMIGIINFDNNLRNTVYEGVFHTVKTDKDINYSSELKTVNLNSKYSYKIEFINNQNALKDLVIYDNLETAQEDFINWKGTLLNIDTSEAQRLGYKILIYYNESNENGELSKDISWKKYDDTIDKTKIKSLAFKILNSDGTTVIKKTNQNIPIYINMLSPNDSKIDSIAYSKVSASYKTITNDKENKSISNIVRLALPGSILVDREKPKAKFHDVVINKTKSGENSIVKLLKIGEDNSIEKIITTTRNKINYLPSGKYKILTDLKYKSLVINSTNNNISINDNIINIPNDLEKKETITIDIDYEFNDAEIPEENKKDKGYTSFDNKENLYKLIIK